MKIDKLKRIAASVTAAAVLLLVILLSIMVYQIVYIKAKEREINALESEIERLEKQNEQTEDNIEIWLSEWKIKERARELNYKQGR